MKTYNTAEMSDEEIAAFCEKVRRERWVWTYNGMVLPHDEEGFNFSRSRGDTVGLLFKAPPQRNYDIPVMG